MTTEGAERTGVHDEVAAARTAWERAGFRLLAN